MSKDCTIQDVFHRFYPSFESTHSISPAQRKAAYHIMNCKTGAFGVNVSVCEDCGCISVQMCIRDRDLNRMMNITRLCFSGRSPIPLMPLMIWQIL